MYDLTRFTLGDMAECGATLRKLGADAHRLDEVAECIVRYLYDQLRDKDTGAHACALVRVFKTYTYAALDTELQTDVRRQLGSQPAGSAMKCLTLVASAGVLPTWNAPHTSVRHRVLPLPSAAFLARAPMLAQLVQQLGLEIANRLDPDPKLIVDPEQKTYNVFHVTEATGSLYIPAQQDFVVPFGIRSVLGFGGQLPPDDLFAVILFARVPIPRETADLFKALALSTKLALLPFAIDTVFAAPAGADPSEA
jgi:hypothetical protein